MKFLRKSSFITVIFFGIWLFATFSYSMQEECSCCSQKEYQRRCIEKRHAEQLSLRYKNHCRHEGNHCSCIKCGNSDNKKVLSSKIYFTRLEKKQVLSFGQDSLEKKILLPKEDILTSLDNKSTSEFHPLFLLNASFLL